MAPVAQQLQEVGRQLELAAQAELAALPAAERLRIESILGANRDGRGRRGEIFTPAGCGKRR